MGRGAEAAAHVDVEAAHDLAVLHPGAGDGAEVVHHHERAGLVGAAGEGDLELAPEVLAVGVAEQEPGEGVGVGGHVERLGVADAGQGAPGHVAHRVAAGLAGGDAHRGQPAHDRRRVVQVHEVQLHVLAGGDVEDGVRVLLGHLGQHLELLGGDPAVRDLDPQHARGVPDGLGALGEVAGGVLQAARGHAVVPAPVVVALAVGPAPQAGLGEHALLHLALPPKLDLRLELVDLDRQIRRHTVDEGLPPLLRVHVHPPGERDQRLEILLSLHGYGKYPADGAGAGVSESPAAA